MTHPSTPFSKGTGRGNPLLPGYFADPSIIQHQGTWYIYATLDPWGGETLGCWESPDFLNWTYRTLNWPTKQACSSPTSSEAMVWAPSVVRARDGQFYMYVSVGSEVWVGTAKHPLGPWRNPLGDIPMIPRNHYPGYHMIDAEAFIDTDGQPYLYWGSGLNWVNGRCWAVPLRGDMRTFAAEPVDVTPSNYFEAPFMVKRGGRYYLMYSQGSTVEDTYQVHYAVGKSPLGPFTEAQNSPILVTDVGAGVISPGHHAVFTVGEQAYILYHRKVVPPQGKLLLREICVDELHFTADGLLHPVRPTQHGPELPAVAGTQLREQNLAHLASITASSASSEATMPDHVLDGSYATRWQAAPVDAEPWLQLDLGAPKDLTRLELRPEYAWKPQHISITASVDGQKWETVADHRLQPVSGSPIGVACKCSARYLRLQFHSLPAALIEWRVY